MQTFAGEHDDGQRAADRPHAHEHFELLVSERGRVAVLARLLLVHLLERGRGDAFLGHPAQPVVDKPALEYALHDQVGRADVRRAPDEAQPDVELVKARASRPQVVEHRGWHLLRLHEVLLVQTFDQHRVFAALQPVDPVGHAALRREPLAERLVHRVLRHARQE